MADDAVLCVLAGAGTGKTGVLTLRVARRCADRSTTARHTLVCTFSRKAAGELGKRLDGLGVSGATTGTIHRLALVVLRDWRDRLGAAQPLILGDRRRVIAAVLGSGDGLEHRARILDTEIAWAKAQACGPDQYEDLARKTRRHVRLPLDAVAEFFAAYQAECRKRGVLDLDDLLLEALAAIEGDERFAEALRWRFRHLFVDEFQDLNAVQFRLIQALCGSTPDLFVVGDPNQSIYGWNGADPALLTRFADLFGGARIVRLDDNHRSSPAIVRFASAALGVPVPPRSTRAQGPVPLIIENETDVEEADWAAGRARLSHQSGGRWSGIALLARTNAQLRIVAEVLHRQGIPYRFAAGDVEPASDLGAADRDGTVQGDPAEQSATDEHGDALILSSFHRSKGLQWRSVIVIGLNEGTVPIASARSTAALDEERRLLYVALTRAEDELACSWVSGAGVRGTARRLRSRWLAAMERERDALEVERAPADADAVASHLALLRSIVSDGAGHDMPTAFRGDRPAPR